MLASCLDPTLDPMWHFALKESDLLLILTTLWGRQEIFVPIMQMKNLRLSKG